MKAPSVVGKREALRAIAEIRRRLRDGDPFIGGPDPDVGYASDVLEILERQRRMQAATVPPQPASSTWRDRRDLA